MNHLLILPLLLLGLAASAQNVLIGKGGTNLSGQDATTIIRLRCAPLKPTERPLFVVNGTVADSICISQINPDQIDSVSVMKAPAATKRYGDLAKNGVLLITLQPGVNLK